YTTPADASAGTVAVEARIGAAPFAPYGVPLTGAGQVLIRLGAPDDDVDVHLVARDRAGRVTGTSATATVTVQAIDGDDITVDSMTGNRIKVGTLEVDAVTPAFGD